VDIIEALKADYARFPENQTYSLYAEDVWFKDPLTSFKGVGRYRSMIGFMGQWFKAVKMELHNIQQIDQRIETTWTLRWIAPVPWEPKMAISGRSELMLNEAGLICSHVDDWDCTRLDVLRQLFSRVQ
jgi:Uncharacterized conserved protein (DUF2358)